MLLSSPAWPQDFPSRPIRFVIPFAPGGPADVSARTLSVMLTQTLGQTLVIDNRAGGSGIVAAEIVVRARPDGHTILMCSTSVMVINPLVSPAIPYDALRDLTPVSLVTSSPYLLLASASFPAATVKELVALAKAKPGALNFGSAGIGSTSHLVAEIFRSMAGIEMTHVPYKGSSLAATDLIAGQIQLLFESVSSALPNVNSGRLRALGISSLKRFALMPQVPPISESGVPGYQAATWQGVCAPSGTPKPVIAKLNRAIGEAVHAPATVQRYAALGAEAVGGTPEEFLAFIKAEIPRWASAIRASGAQSR